MSLSLVLVDVRMSVDWQENSVLELLTEYRMNKECMETGSEVWREI
jgi:hypothetical protein